MPIGKTVELWAICDRCGKIMQYDGGLRGSIKDTIADLRARGWTVRASGEAICPKCKKNRNEKIDNDGGAK